MPESMISGSLPRINLIGYSRSIERSWTGKQKRKSIALAIIMVHALIHLSSEGLRDINELKEAYKEKIQAAKKKATVEMPLPPSPTPSSETQTSSTSPFPPPPPPPQPKIPQVPKPNIKTLSSYLDVDKTRALAQKEIEAIWRLRHASNPTSLCATIPLSTYRTIEETAKKHPHFILPLPKEGQGAEIHFLQWTFPAPDTVVVLFTNLAEYKLRGEFSQPHTTVTHHLELAEEKGVVLLQGQVVEGRGVSVDEAKFLLMTLQKFYGFGKEKPERRELLEKFARGDEGFSLEALVEEAEKAV
jgi:ATP synthase F1 complex assembly factor 1